jgi:HK97 gp10 family phage protein
MASAVTADDPAAIYVEFGTSAHQAQPFLRPAFDRHTTGVTAEIAGELRG